MEVWVTERSIYGNIKLISVWDTEKNALQHIVANIMSLVSCWDLSDNYTKMSAIDINDAVAVGQYYQSISFFNDYQDVVDLEYREYFSLLQKNILTNPSLIHLIDFTIPDDSVMELVSVAGLSLECPCGIVRTTCDYHKP